MHNPGRHAAKKINASRLTKILFAVFVGGLVIAAVIASLVNPAANGAHSHTAPSSSAPAPTHVKTSPVPTAPSPGRTAPSKPKPPAHAKSAVVRYTVKLGDNLSSIAAKYHLKSYVPLYDANHAAIGNNPNLIHVGLQLTVPIPQNGA